MFFPISQTREIPGITIFRSSSTVYFANAELYLEALKEKVCFESFLHFLNAGSFIPIISACK